jgi:hypothetical protein
LFEYWIDEINEQICTIIDMFYCDIITWFSYPIVHKCICVNSFKWFCFQDENVTINVSDTECENIVL